MIWQLLIIATTMLVISISIYMTTCAFEQKAATWPHVAKSTFALFNRGSEYISVFLMLFISVLLLRMIHE